MYVDLYKYQGQWYEIARLPQWFQNDCIKSVANYTVLSDFTLKITNYCQKNKDISYINGIATPNYLPQIIDNTLLYPGSFTVKFNGIPFTGNYNILYVDASYSYALVGSNSMNDLWILSKHMYPNQFIIDEMISYAQKIGYNVKKLYWTPKKLKP